MSSYEQQVDREAVTACFQAFRHPSRLPQFFRDLFSGTAAYWRAEDVVDLDRVELIRIVSYARRMAFKMCGSTFIIGFLVGLAVIRGVTAEPTKWTPDDFDWGALTAKQAPPEEWAGLYINLTEVPRPMVAEHEALLAVGQPAVIGSTDVVFIAFSLGLAWQAFKVAAAIGSVVTAIQGCTTSDGSAASVAGCAFGLAGTIISIGDAYSAAKGAGWFARAATTWGGSGIESIALDVFQKRELQEKRQLFHEEVMSHVLTRSFGKPEFMGYVADSHRLSRRDGEHLHPRAPIYRITHPKHGLIDIASREHVNSTRFTISYANQGLEKRQSFQHERLSDHSMEARFDYGASQADPAKPSFDAAGGYQGVENAVNCLARGQWRDASVLSGQFYDNDAHATFGFFSLGIFDNNDQDGQLQAYAPTGMPLPVC